MADTVFAKFRQKLTDASVAVDAGLTLDQIDALASSCWNRSLTEGIFHDGTLGTVTAGFNAIYHAYLSTDREIPGGWILILQGVHGENNIPLKVGYLLNEEQAERLAESFATAREARDVVAPEEAPPSRDDVVEELTKAIEAVAELIDNAKEIEASVEQRNRAIAMGWAVRSFRDNGTYDPIVEDVLDRAKKFYEWVETGA